MRAEIVDNLIYLSVIPLIDMPNCLVLETKTDANGEVRILGSDIKAGQREYELPQGLSTRDIKKVYVISN